MPDYSSNLTSYMDTYNLIGSLSSVYTNLPAMSWPFVIFHNGQFDDEMAQADVRSGVFLNIINRSRDGHFGLGYGGAHSTWRIWKLVESMEFMRIEWENKLPEDGSLSRFCGALTPLY